MMYGRMATIRKILLADDDRVTRELLAAAVREMPDAIVLDIGMPGRWFVA